VSRFADELGTGERRALNAAFAALVVTIAGACAHSALGLGGDGLTQPIRDWASSAVYVIVAAIVALRVVRIGERRGPWIVLCAGIALYGAGNLLWALWLEHVAAPPIPSICDVLWLSLYPCSYAGLAWLARRGPRLPAGVWLDGIIAGLGLAALGAAIVFEPVLQAATGSTTAVTTNLAYPVGDLLLAALVVGILALRGWRVDRGWALLGCGFLVLCVGDFTYLLQVASGSSDSSLLANIFYMSGMALLAVAAWTPMHRDPPERLEGMSVMVVPAAFVLAALGLLVYDHVEGIGSVAFALAIATLAATVVRTGLAFRDVRDFADTRRMALTDDLTSLPNRRLFSQQLDEAIETATASRGPFALLMVDLDDFKELNDTLGHATGDSVLREVALRLAAALRPDDMLARLGGDEFGVVLAPPTTEEGALAATERLRAALEAHFDVRGLHLRVAASVGIAVHPVHGSTAEELLQRADVAMYDAKARRAGHAVYTRERNPYSRARLALAAELPGALASGQIEVFFQPKARAADRRMVGAEALVRWRHPERGLLAPSVFIEFAERSGLMRELTRHVLGSALAQCAAWRAAGHELHVAVNTSATDLLDTGLPGEVAAALAVHEVPAESLILEVTESSVLSDPTRIGMVLEALRELGIGLSLDDFGTGYSALTHLRTLPVDEVKVDRSFVSSMATEPADAAIVEATIGLAQRLGIRAVAEGVEDDVTWERLAALGCDLIQGFALSRPVPAAELEALLWSSGPLSRIAAPAEHTPQ
jgi:diguanylate cyclase (GGDEF)-like protein